MAVVVFQRVRVRARTISPNRDAGDVGDLAPASCGTGDAVDAAAGECIFGEANDAGDDRAVKMFCTFGRLRYGRTTRASANGPNVLSASTFALVPAMPLASAAVCASASRPALASRWILGLVLFLCARTGNDSPRDPSPCPCCAASANANGRGCARGGYVSPCARAWGWG